jgi:hypothetical protein
MTASPETRVDEVGTQPSARCLADCSVISRVFSYPDKAIGLRHLINRVDETEYRICAYLKLEFPELACPMLTCPERVVKVSCSRTSARDMRFWAKQEDAPVRSVPCADDGP